MKTKKGISLIVLVITIIVLAILAATVVLSLSDTDIIDRAQGIVDENNKQAIQEEIEFAILTVRTNNKGKTKLDEVSTSLANKGYTVTETADGLTVVKNDMEFAISNKGKVTFVKVTDTENGDSGNTGGGNTPTPTPTGSKASALYDANIGGAVSGYKANKLQVGDFIDYDAGSWPTTMTATSITGGAGYDAGTNGDGSTLPTKDFSFGGFKAGASKNGNAVPWDTTYNYIKKNTDNTAITGWRVFDITGDTITLISAGSPEDYYFSVASNTDYISEYILAGDNASDTAKNAATGYTARNWTNDYAKGTSATNNISGVAESARALSKTELDTWYSKYMKTDSLTTYDTYTNSTFQLINGTQYDNVVNNYAFNWLASAYDSNGVYNVSPGGRFVDGSGGIAYGLRVLVSLKSNILLENAGTVELKDAYTEGNTYTYNVWNITGLAE